MAPNSGDALSSPAVSDGRASPALDALRRHWSDYAKEAFGLFCFMIGAGAFTTLFMHPGSPVNQAIPSDLGRHIGVGLLMGCVTAAIIYSPWGQKSGAHINPAVTWSFYRLGKIAWWDAIFYTVFQFLGGIVAPLVLLALIGEPFAHEKVKYATSQPGEAGTAVAFAFEFAMSFVLMLVLLLAINSERWEKKAGAFAALLIAFYIAFESPYSGMSLNPARSFGSALTAGQWKSMWLYFVAPVLAMLLATELFLWMRRRGTVGRADAGDEARCLVCDFKDGPNYPVDDPA